MGTLVAVLSQLFWGVTIGALTGTVGLILKVVLTAGGVFGSGFAIFNWRKLRDRLSFRRR
ncbi:hypothetical protein GGR39_000151 [Novosphingobium fluoreni]|uniref:Uncharacterized protein n=1 Tax=Novosphingobium fluoreni TaxID=1391222 RepID=A0A7W6FXW1_9SPHN|nr:hypothetical protein [Novosphingobium fluoreni]MBB3938522.1 hypothetical protein [Novosphingobium fluoreni]